MTNSGLILKLYRSCMDAMHDVEYCTKVIEVVIDVAGKQVFTYLPEGRTKPRFHVVLPRSDVDYTAGVLVGTDKKSVIVVLLAPHHIVWLHYEFREDGKHVLKSATIYTLEVAALMNGPLKQPKDSEEAGL